VPDWQAVWEKINAHLGDRITLQATFPSPGAYRATIYETEQKQRTFISTQVPGREHPRGVEEPGSMFMVLPTARLGSRIVRAVDDEFRNSTTQTKTERSELSARFINALGNVKRFC